MFKKYIVKDLNVVNIGRSNDISYDNNLVSSHHAKLVFNGKDWTIDDQRSANGTYVNGSRVNHKILEPCDLIYIMWLQIVVISRYVFAVNNPQSLMKINNINIFNYVRQKINEKELLNLSEKDYFFRFPRV